MYGTFWSLMPFLVVIPIAIVTRQVLPGLMIGLLVGSYMLHPTLLGGINAAIDYILKELAIPDNLRLIVFLYGFGAFVGLVRVTGGVRGFSRWMSQRVRTTRGAFALTWVSALGTFMAPDFRIITVAPVVRQVFERLQVPAKRVALVIDLTSTPLTALVPLGTVFVGYMVGLLGTANRHHGLAFGPYHLLLVSLPFNFFSLLILAYGLFDTFLGARRSSRAAARTGVGRHRVTHSMISATGGFAAEAAGELHPGGADAPPRESQTQASEPADSMEAVAAKAQPRAFNLLFPLALLLSLTLVLTWWNGYAPGRTVWQALVQANAARAMLQALLITLVVSVTWYSITRQPMHRTMFGFLAGGNEMMAVIVLLSLVWAVSAVSTDLGFTTYTAHAIGGLVPARWIAPALFVFGCLISYVIGSSFGTWGILMPLGFTLAASTHASLPLIAGAVFASGTFGGFVSPLSDNTVAMATVMKLPVMEYARYKLRPALLAAGGSVAAYALAGWL
ncbi:MAG: sodium:proton antiporter [Alicyclobacillus sp.]|nr:sodium:proton antiporter [Alicyclobacillus sp.]